MSGLGLAWATCGCTHVRVQVRHHWSLFLSHSTGLAPLQAAAAACVHGWPEFVRRPSVGLVLLRSVRQLPWVDWHDGRRGGIHVGERRNGDLPHPGRLREKDRPAVSDPLWTGSRWAPPERTPPPVNQSKSHSKQSYEDCRSRLQHGEGDFFIH